MAVMRSMPGRLPQEPELVKPGAEYNHREQRVEKVFDIFHVPVFSVWVGEDTY